MNPAFEGYFGIPRGNKNIDNVLKVLDSSAPRSSRLPGSSGLEASSARPSRKPRLEQGPGERSGFWTDYAFTVDRSLISADGLASIMFDLSAVATPRTTTSTTRPRTPWRARRRATGWRPCRPSLGTTSRHRFPSCPSSHSTPTCRARTVALYVKLLMGNGTRRRTRTGRRTSRRSTRRASPPSPRRGGVPPENSPQLFK